MTVNTDGAEIESSSSEVDPDCQDYVPTTIEQENDGQDNFDSHEVVVRETLREEPSIVPYGEEAFFTDTILEIIDETVLNHIFGQSTKFDFPPHPTGENTGIDEDDAETSIPICGITLRRKPISSNKVASIRREMKKLAWDMKDSV
ncbi:hypothetical protein Scep_011482 [Stephania cephalantha]|uniref:Uncharacterized protein n=1 Tax=Stephania cephalantha TaxID=152367 RepID=A0AAP0JDC5_9MAGN